jgi:hypothetical protein
MAEKDSNKVILHSEFRMIKKKELRDKIFGNRYHFLNCIDRLGEQDAEFFVKYAYFKLKNLMPQNLVERLLDHIDCKYEIVSSIKQNEDED